MSDGSSKIISTGPGTLSLLGILFVGLKLTGVINWSWWWVTLPFWGPIAVLLFLLVSVMIVIGVLSIKK